jgi:acyl dehydratase
MSKPSQVIPEQVIGYEVGTHQASYTQNDVMLYAAAIGASTDPMDREDLNFTFELAEEFKVLPTFGVVMASTASLSGLSRCPGMPEFNPMMLLHGEQTLEIVRPIPISGDIRSKVSIVDVADKGKGALVTTRSEKFNSSGELICVCDSKAFIRGIGGFGFKGALPVENLPSPSNRAPDATAREKTFLNQAVLYRLTGDKNPLHVSPEMAAKGNFDKPILHGLCSFGFASRAVLKHFCGNDVT